MKKIFFIFYFLLFLSFSFSSPPLLDSLEKDLDDFFDGTSPRRIYKDRAKVLLGQLKDESLKKIAIQTAKFVFPDKGKGRFIILDYLLEEKSFKSISEFKDILSVFQNKKESYCDLRILPRITKLKELVDNFLLANFIAEAKKEVISLLENINQDIKLSPNAAHTGPALEVIKILEKGLERRQISGDNSPYFSHDNENNPLPLFVKLANSFSEDTQNLKAKDCLPVWGLLASSYLKVALEAFETGQQFTEVLDYFVPELIKRIEKERTSYHWFTIFTNRLSILMTHPSIRHINLGFNTRFDVYKAALTLFQHNGAPGWYTHFGYKKACKNTGADYTKNLFSPLALSKGFPGIVMLPYPFNLSGGDILETMPSPGGSHLWALGYAFSTVWADGSSLTPSLFMAHDQQHLAEMVQYLSYAPYLFVNNEETYVPTVEQVWRHNQEGRKLYYAALKVLQEMASSTEDPDQKCMNTFFGFQTFHEKVSALHHRLGFLIGCDDFFDDCENGFGYLIDDHYYLSLLSDLLKETTNDYDAFIKAYKSYREKFQKEFILRDQSGELIKSIKNWMRFSCPRNKEVMILNITIKQFGFEIKNTQTNVEGHIKIPLNTSFDTVSNKYRPGSIFQRYYFLGSPLYLGDTPPKYKMETFSRQE